MTKKGTTVRTIRAMKKRGEPIVALTAYDYTTALLEERAGVDLILVGDSFNMAVLGEETTLNADLDVLLAVTRAVVKGAPDTLVVGDMPFGSYQCSPAQAVGTAVEFLASAGAGAVKLEGGNDRAVDCVRAIVDSGIPVMGHIGLLPQSLRMTGGYRVVRSGHRDRMLAEAAALQDAGVFSMVLESVDEELAREITGSLEVPTIGIGAGRYTDGQILVVNDILGLNLVFSPKFVKKYVDLAGEIGRALDKYVEEVRNGEFPGEENVYTGNGKTEEQ
jgi:3-methyl-2-oxobutanoate hydroxymethyltransferase